MRENSINAKRYAAMGIMLLSIYLAAAGPVPAQSTAFTYQGRLTDGGSPANGNYDIEFRLFDAVDVGTGTQVGGNVTVSNVSVSSGLFTTLVDFAVCPVCFNGSTRYLQVSVRPTGGSTFTTLSPRQPIASTPYAIRSTIANGLSCLNCISSNEIFSLNGNKVTGTIPVASVPAGSDNYVRNGTAVQNGHFNISGTGTAGSLGAETVNATAYFMLNERIFWNAGQISNLFAGRLAGNINVSGVNNSFFGNEAGSNNASGGDNSFFGSSAGKANFNGGGNSVFGSFAGHRNTSGSQNAFFGALSGQHNTEGGSNVFVGSASGDANNTGSNNSFFGVLSGGSNTTGSNNTAVGFSSGGFITTESANTFIGANSSGAAGVTNATAIGFKAKVTQSNSLVLGSLNNINGATADTNVGIGTTAPAARLHIAVNSSNLLFGSGGCNSGNAAIGFVASFNVCNNYSLLGDGTHTIINRDTGGTISFREANTAQMIILPRGKVGIGTTVPDQTLSVGSGNASKPSGGSWLTFSDERLKNIKGRFTPGLKAVMQLQPLRYEYKSDNALVLKSAGEHVGFIAQAVQKIIPEAVTTNDKGYLLVNNDPIMWTMLNAIKEQQTQIGELKEQLRQQHALIVDLKTQFGRPTRRRK